MAERTPSPDLRGSWPSSEVFAAQGGIQSRTPALLKGSCLALLRIKPKAERS